MSTLGQILRHKRVTATSRKKKDEVSVESLDYTRKILHAAWHPRDNILAIAATNNLYLFHEQQPQNQQRERQFVGSMVSYRTLFSLSHSWPSCRLLLLYIVDKIVSFYGAKMLIVLLPLSSSLVSTRACNMTQFDCLQSVVLFTFLLRVDFVVVWFKSYTACTYYMIFCAVPLSPLSHYLFLEKLLYYVCNHTLMRVPELVLIYKSVTIAQSTKFEYYKISHNQYR